MKEEDKKEGLFKRIKIIEDKNEEQLKAIKSKNENIEEVTEFVEEPLKLKQRLHLRKLEPYKKMLIIEKLKLYVITK